MTKQTLLRSGPDSKPSDDDVSLRINLSKDDSRFFTRKLLCRTGA